MPLAASSKKFGPNIKYSGPLPANFKFENMNRHLLYGTGFLIAAAVIPYLGELQHQPPSLLLESLIIVFGLLGLSFMIFAFTKLTQRWSKIVLGVYLAGVALMLIATPAGLLYAQASSDWTLIGRVTMTDLFWPLVLVIKALHIPAFYY